MTTYRVGAAGATVFDSEGRAIRRLQPGWVVVEGVVETEGSLAQQLQAGYADKKLRPAENKPTPARRPDPRLSNCVLEGGRSKTYEDKSL